MNREQYEEAKKTFKEVNILLEQGSRTAEERHKLEESKAQLAGLLMRPWFPFGWWRRLTMIALFLIGLYGVISGVTVVVMVWLLILLFSPRITGEALRVLGRIFRGTYT